MQVISSRPAANSAETSLLPEATANLKHPDEAVELTPEEIRTALLAARIQKGAALRQAAYAQRVSEPRLYATLNFRQLWTFALARIRQSVPAFKLDEQNKHIFTLLCLYFAQDERLETEYGYSLAKGIMLVGPVGCGKTTLMRAFAVNSHNSFHEVSCRQVAYEYSMKDTGGAQAIRHYSQPKEAIPDNHFGQRQIGYFFDDLGTEGYKKHFGNEVNMMEEILLNRYDVPALHPKTHLTTNLTADDLERLYGSRVRSRIRGMLNWITFNEQAPDRR